MILYSLKPDQILRSETERQFLPNITIDIESPYYKYCKFSKYVMEDISSTDIRQYLNDKKDISELVPKQAADYIKRNGLYSE